MLQDCSHCGGKNQHVIIKNTTWNVLIYCWRQIRTSGMTFVIKHDTLHKLETAYADEHVTGTYSHAKMHLWFRCLKPKILLLFLYNSTCTEVIFKWKNIKLYLAWNAKSHQSILLSFYIYFWDFHVKIRLTNFGLCLSCMTSRKDRCRQWNHFKCQ